MSKYVLIPLLLILSLPTILSLLAFVLSRASVVVNTALTELFSFVNYFTLFLPSVQELFAKLSLLWEATHWSVAALSGFLALVMYLSAYVELIASTKLTRVSKLLSEHPTYKQYQQDDKTDYSEILAELNQKESAAPFKRIVIPLFWAGLAIVIAFSTSFLGFLFSGMALIGVIYMLCTRNDDLERNLSDNPSKPSCT